jgi:hypothetical protein
MSCPYWRLLDRQFFSYHVRYHDSRMINQKLEGYYMSTSISRNPGNANVDFLPWRWHSLLSIDSAVVDSCYVQN